MKRIESVYREILYQAIEKQNKTLTQSYLAKALNLSLSTVNLAVKPLARMNAIKIKKRSFDIIDIRKILFYWASIRNIEKDIIYQTRADKEIRKIESEMPSGIIYGAYTAYRLKFKEIPADYSEIYIYSDNRDDIKKRFPPNKKQPNLFVLKKDNTMDKYPKTCTIAQIFVDLWNLKEWYAKDFLNALETRLNYIK